jgi:hypothetical protein
MQNMTSEINKMKRWSLHAPATAHIEAENTQQVISCKGISEAGSLLQIRPKTTTLLVQLSTAELQNGSPMVAPLRNGRQWDHSCGFMESVRLLSITHGSFMLMTLSYSGCRKERALVCVTTYCVIAACSYLRLARASFKKSK